MKKLALLVLLFVVASGYSQQLVFEMSAFGIRFGTMTVTKTKENDSTDLYTLNAKGYLKVLWMERNDQTLYEVRYRHGKLLSSAYKQIETGEVKKWTNVMFDGKKYVVDSYRGKRTFTEVPVHSIITLYFSNPKNIKRIFYEAESDFAEVKYPDENTVEIKSSDGNRSVYHFKNGTMDHMEFYISIAIVNMKRIS
ncbi:MAG: hypothetical protein KIS94_09870 [Chitinophagales bacterium]|nr:hypothetical protein [Chitinophagales bacterium]